MFNKKYLTQEHTENINDTVEIFQRQQDLPKNICDNLETTKVRTLHFYITPKVHERCIPGKPIESFTDFHKSKNSKLVYHYLQPHSKALPSYVQDTTDFINKLKTVKDESKDFILVTLDVRALHTNIPNDKSIEVVKKTLNNQTTTTFIIF